MIGGKIRKVHLYRNPNHREGHLDLLAFPLCSDVNTETVKTHNVRKVTCKRCLLLVAKGRVIK